MVNKNVVVLMSILTIVITGLIVYFSIKPYLNIKYTFGEEEYETTAKIINDDNIENTEIIDNTVENTEKNDETSKNETENENSSSENTINEKDTEKKTGKELAVELAKKKWGEKDTSVYYYVEEKKSEDVYIISVRNRETTTGMIDYEVNIKTGTVEEY